MGHEKYGLYLLGDTAIHQGHLKLMLEVGDGPETTDHNRRPLLFRIVDQESMKGIDPHPFHSPHRIPDNLHPLLCRKKGGFFGIGGDGYNHPGKDPQPPLEDVAMAIGKGIKGPRIDRKRSPHRSTSPAFP